MIHSHLRVICGFSARRYFEKEKQATEIHPMTC